jgi:hypothetical protein
VDVPVGSAFLFFLAPERYVPVGPDEWRALREAGELAETYPDPLSIPEYGTYLDACRALTDRFDCDPWTLYRALWRLASE